MKRTITIEVDVVDGDASVSCSHDPIFTFEDIYETIKSGDVPCDDQWSMIIAANIISKLADISDSVICDHNIATGATVIDDDEPAIVSSQL